VTLHACGSSRKVIFLGDEFRGTGLDILALSRVQLLDFGSEDLSQAPLFYRPRFITTTSSFPSPTWQALPSERSQFALRE